MTPASAATPATCPFCAIARGDAPAHVVLETDQLVAFLDARPVFLGHTLLAPRRHAVTLPDLRPDELAPFLSSVQQLVTAVQAGLGAQGAFVAVNNVVSQSVPHLHAHVVPRTKGDGLRGFFWPRRRYADDDDAAEHARRLRAALPGTA